MPSKPVQSALPRFLQPTALIRVYDSTAEEQSRSVIDDFESYADSKAVAAAYQQNSSGDSLTLSLDTEHVKNGKAALKYDYSVTDGGAGYCGATKTSVVSSVTL